MLGRVACLVLVLGFGCSVEELDLTGKRCPCAAGWTCDTATDRCVLGAPSTGGSSGGGSGGGTSGTSVCQVVGESMTLTLTCPEGSVISSIDFASYGNVSATCAEPKQGTCHSAASKGVAECNCLGKPSCSYVASNSLHGDPCFQMEKKLLVSATCAPAADASAGGSGGTCPVATGGTGGSGGIGASGGAGGSGGTTGGSGGTTSGGSGGTGGSSGGSGGTGGSAGHVACGPSICSLASGEECCIANTPACQPSSQNCPGVEVACDGPSDCPSGEVCCAAYAGSKIASIGCTIPAKCNPDKILCGSSSTVCQSGLTCKPNGEYSYYNVCAP